MVKPTQENGFQLGKFAPFQKSNVPQTTEQTLKNPLDDFQCHDLEISEGSRRVCSRCTVNGRSRTSTFQIFCPDCFFIPDDIQLPQLELPVRLIIIRHQDERISKSTAIHAKLLTMEKSVEYHVFNKESAGALTDLLCNQLNVEETALLLPTKFSKTVQEYKEQKRGDDWKLRNLVVLDGSWRHVRSISSHLPILRRLPNLRLTNNYQTSFWRCQKEDESHLATIEAITYFYREWMDGSRAFDDLMCIYKWQYQRIQQAHTTSQHQS